MKTRFFPMRALWALCFLSCAAAAATPPATTGEKWLKLTSEHFEIFTCGHERGATQLLVKLEQFREFFLRALRQRRVYEPKLQIFIFDSKEHFTRYLDTQKPGRKEHTPLGLHMGSRLQSRVTVLQNRLSQSTIIHEYVHSLAYARLGRDLPLWFNEGLATVFDTFSTNGDTVTFGKMHERRFLAASDISTIPLVTLFAVKRESPYYTGGELTTKFYAQSWLLLHYAMLGKNNEPYTMENMLRFVDEVTRLQADTARAFARAFGSDYSNLEKALDSYMRAGEYSTMTATIPVKPIKDKITTRAVTDEEREIELAGLAWRSVAGDSSALSTLRRLEKKYPENPRIHEILAETQIRKGDNKAVASCLEKAVARNTANPLVHVELLKTKNIKPAKPGSLMSGRMAAESTSLVDGALKLAPNCMEAQEMLAIIESQNPDIRVEKIASVLEALPSMRERDKTRYALAVIFWRLKRHDEALAWINELAKELKPSDETQLFARELRWLIAKETGGKAP